MKKLISILLLVFAPCWSAENQIEFNFGRGTPWGSVQAGGSSDRNGARGTEWSADIMHEAHPRIYWGLGGGQFRSNDNVSQTFVANAFSTISSKVSSILILARTDIPSQSSLVPYIIVGVGWVHNSLSIAAVPNGAWADTGTAESRNLLTSSRNTMGYAYGVGADYALSSRVFIGVEARYQSSLKTTFELTPAGTATTGQNSVETSLNVFMASVKAGIKY